MGSVNVGYEIRIQIALGKRFQGLGDHDRTKVRSTYTDVDNSVYCLARVALPLAVSDGLGEFLHVLKDFADLVNPLFVNREVTEVSQSNVKYGAVLGCIYMRSREHLVASIFDLGLTKEIEEFLKDRFGNQVFRVIEQDLNARATLRVIGGR